MRHHLRKAKEIYARKGPLQAIRSTFRYVPIEINNFFFRLQYGTGTYIMEEDWDNLLILDACRYDMFEDRITLEGNLNFKISLGSSSEEYLERNFESKTCHDTVYVNANPYIPRLGLDQGTFHAVRDCLKKWDRELQTVRPKTVADEARRAIADFPNKRLIVHFMQPHTPFIGELGRRMVGGGWTMDLDVEENPGVWHRLREGDDQVDLETVRKAYYENLEVVLSEIEPLIQDLDGKTVVTSDHGNLVGERLGPVPTRRKFGHPYGVHCEELLKVPWFEIPSETRRRVNVDPPVETDSTVEDAVLEERLVALGYR